MTYNTLITITFIAFSTLLCTSCLTTTNPDGSPRPNTLPRDGSNLFPGQSPYEPDWTRSQPGNDYPNGGYYPYYIPLGY